MFAVLTPFTTPTRRFSPAVTPVISPDDLADCVIPIEVLVARKWIEPQGAAPADGEAAVAELQAPDFAPVAAKKK